MINKDNFKDLLIFLEFSENGNVFSKHFTQGDFYLKVDFTSSKLIYPPKLKIGGEFTTNFSSSENFVVFECVHRLLKKGYKPEHIELEPKWKLGHGAGGGRADIFIKNHEEKPLLIIECKTFGKEFDKEWKDMQVDGGQLFSYIEQEKDIEFVCLYASDFDEKLKLIIKEQRIISHKDNDKILSEDPKLKAFKNAKNVKERFKVWKDTYLFEFTEKGLFEDNIQAYQIGKDKYTLDIDTKIIDATDKKGKYHQFRTILRKHNVSRRENAFEVLVNLFLCKIVDEKENSNDLKFYWKGIAYDNYFDLVDRLQSLYKIGMEKFLEQEITYISDQQIDDIFWSFKQKGSAVKQEVKAIFKELKFYKGLDFEFIKVHNKEKFDKNAKILLEIIQMWQGLRLKTKEQNQFLGDMFEFFLDNGIKQSEGQFFTPVPICKFIVMSLPLESKVKATNEALKAIDYACGSGHFLTEYALQIKPIVKQHKGVDKPIEYYKNIFGIEKEDRLAKVAKVSAFMYGLDEIQIIDADALIHNDKIKEEKFDVLVANPPFAVEDFLMTLEEEDRDKYELFSPSLDLGNKNIQCFFLERAKQLLIGGGIAGIVVPVSILSNADSMHVQTREMLLKFFDFVSIVELGSGTFGKTGTNTVVLFLRRKAQRPEPSIHYQNRVQEFFENWDEELKSGGGAYLDIDTVKRYCQHIDIPFDDYQSLLKGFPSLELLETELFKDYQNDFYSSTEIVNHKKKKFFKDLDITAQKEDLDKRFFIYLKAIEQDKLYYFMLADNQGKKVLLIKSPSDNKEQKQFLGYEWSGAKGSEGIKYNGGETVYEIETPMFDANNSLNTDKINYWIQQNFEESTNVNNIPEHLQPFLTYTNLPDLLDFSRKDFNKIISLIPKRTTTILTKWESIRLGEIVETLNGLWTGKKAPFLKVNVIRNTNFSKNGKIDLSDVAELEVEVSQYEKRKLEYGDIIIEKSGGSETQAIGRVVFFDKLDGEFSYSNFTSRLRVISEKIKSEYLHLYLNYFYELGYTFDFQNGTSGIKNLNFDSYLSLKIPQPPLSTQQEIITECESLDKLVEDSYKNISEAKDSIEEIVVSTFEKFPKSKLAAVSLLNPSKTEIKNVDENILVSFVEMSSVSNAGYIAEKVDRPLKDLKKGSFTYFAENDIILAKITPCMENGKCALAKGLTNELGMGSSEFHVVRVKENISSKFIFTLLNREVVRKEAEQNFTGSSGHRRVPPTFYQNYQVPVPTLLEQEKLVVEIEKLEKIISDNQLIIENAPVQKQDVMKKYL